MGYWFCFPVFQYFFVQTYFLKSVPTLPPDGCGSPFVEEVRHSPVMSGVYDLNVVVKGKSLQDVANFVAKELSAMESVTSTATHFVMRRYKELDVELLGSGKDERGSYSL